MTHISRRNFLQASAAGMTAAAFSLHAGRAADEKKPAVKLPAEVIDTHTHFYDPTRKEGVPWPGKGDKVLYKPTLPDHFMKVAGPHGVTGTVVVEASPWVEDNQWLLDLAAKNPSVVGVCGNLVPGTEKFAEHLARFTKNPLFVGFRISSDVLKKGLENPTVIADFKRVQESGRQVDINGGPDMLPDIARLAKSLPDLRICINHLANVRIDGKAPPADWVKGMEACAAGKNVFQKVSALHEGATMKDEKGLAPRDHAYYRPILDAVWKVWGDDRVIYGSDWPVSARAGDYGEVIGVVAAYVAERGATASTKFFAGNAKAAYRWPDAKRS